MENVSRVANAFSFARSNTLFVSCVFIDSTQYFPLADKFNVNLHNSLRSWRALPWDVYNTQRGAVPMRYDVNKINKIRSHFRLFMYRRPSLPRYVFCFNFRPRSTVPFSCRLFDFLFRSLKIGVRMSAMRHSRSDKNVEGADKACTV